MLTEQDEELKRIIKTYSIDTKNRKLPYSMKIKQICAQMTAFYRYKRDQRETLDFSLLKNKDYIDMKNNEFQDLKVFMKVECFGEEGLTK